MTKTAGSLHLLTASASQRIVIGGYLPSNTTQHAQALTCSFICFIVADNKFQGHGTLHAIYASVEEGCKAKGWDTVDLLIIGGDFQV